MTDSAAIRDSALLTVAQMYRADAAAAAGGVPSLALMEAAGTAVAREIRRRWRPRPTLVLCGPGNNGGDGFVVARCLEFGGWPVRVGLLGDVNALKGDAAVNARRWRGRVHPVSDDLLSGEPLVVDALFGAGLARPLDGVTRAMVEEIGRRRLDCVGIDVPSGVHGDSGEILGAAPRCRLTVSFFRGKPGHWLLPGRQQCGELVIADIGIPETVLSDIAPDVFLNGPALWQTHLRWPQAADNKYTRGHAVVVGGDRMIGAARMAAEAARRVGAGLVTIAAPEQRFAVYAGGHPGAIVAPLATAADFTHLIADPRRNAVLVGPGAGISAETRERVLAVLRLGKAGVLDADALTVFQEDPRILFREIADGCVLTPHEGEFARLFSATGDKRMRALAAARESHAIVVLKGADTVIAAPDGRCAIEGAAPPDLATAGSGDCLAGFILGLLAQGVPPFAAACAGVWMHGQAARHHGPGLIAEDLIDELPAVLTRLRDRSADASAAATRDPRN